MPDENYSNSDSADQAPEEQPATDVKSQVKQAASDLKSAASAKVGAVKAKAGEYRDAAAAKAQDLKGSVQAAANAKVDDLRSAATAKAEELRGSAEEAWGEAKIKARTYQEDGEAYVKENPTRAILMGVAAGFVLGMLIKK